MQSPYRKESHCSSSISVLHTYIGSPQTDLSNRANINWPTAGQEEKWGCWGVGGGGGFPRPFACNSLVPLHVMTWIASLVILVFPCRDIYCLLPQHNVRECDIYVTHSAWLILLNSFSFAWLELVSHRSFMPKLLTGNAQKGWPYFQRLLVDLFQFMEPFLRNAELGEPVSFIETIVWDSLFI